MRMISHITACNGVHDKLSLGDIESYNKSLSIETHHACGCAS